MDKINESIVIVGGGGGVFRLARFLKNTRKNITTIQTMFDSGGHSGELRDERGVLPPGDIRQAIVALADEEIEGTLRDLLSYRFIPKNGSALDRATVGNILLTALTEITGSPIMAIETLCRWFRVKGKVLPVSIDMAHLCVELSDGSVLEGEGKIDTRPHDDERTIVRAFLKPSARIYVGAYDAIREADKIVFSPGDLYTSLIPNTLTDGFKEAIAKTEAKLIYVVNLVTKKSETHDFTASKFAKTLLTYIGREKFHTIICNGGEIRKEVLELYSKEEAYPVTVDLPELQKLADHVIVEDIADQTTPILRHHERVTSIIVDI